MNKTTVWRTPLLAGILFATGLHAGIVSENSAAALGVTDNVFWSQLGSLGAVMPTNTTAFISTKGVTGTITDASDPARLSLNTLYNLINNPVYDDQSGGPVTINFSTPVFGAGALTMNAFNSTQAFFYHLQAFNAGGSLGTFNFASPQQTNTPTYLGVLDSLQEITKVVISTDAFPGNQGNYFALDTLNLNNGGQAPPGVPEPSSWLLTACGLVLSGVGIRRSFRSN